MNSILMTVFNRSPYVLETTLANLAAADTGNSDTETIIVDDGSTVDYDDLKREHPWARWVRIEADEYPAGTYTIPHEKGGVFNNPAIALNRAIKEAKGDRLIFLGSDCLVSAHGLRRAREAGRLPWFGTVCERKDGHEMIGASRPSPYHWFLSVQKSTVEAIGCFDEEYTRGIACEDDDFGYKLALYCGGYLFGLDVIVVHQTHERFEGEGWDAFEAGWKRNTFYLSCMWGGGPPAAALVMDTNETTNVLEVRVTLRPGYIDPLRGKRLAS